MLLPTADDEMEFIKLDGGAGGGRGWRSGRVGRGGVGGNEGVQQENYPCLCFALVGVSE